MQELMPSLLYIGHVPFFFFTKRKYPFIWLWSELHSLPLFPIYNHAFFIITLLYEDLHCHAYQETDSFLGKNLTDENNDHDDQPVKLPFYFLFLRMDVS